MSSPFPPLPSSVLHVDLNTRSVTRTALSPAYRSQFLGGRGLAARLLADARAWTIEPLDPAASLVIAPGLLSATPWPSSSRVHFGFRSPLTGIYGYANAGGALAHRLAAQGIAAVVVIGRADGPVYLHVEDGKADVRDASFVWGMDSDIAEAHLLDHVAPAPASVACIGPAGEREVPIAGILIDGGRAAARCGGGAVLGQKQLKAIVAISGNTPRWPRRFVSLASAAHRTVASNPGVSALAEWGTPYLVGIKNVTGDLPTRNHRLGQVPFVDQVDARAFEPFRVRTKGCQGCSIRCGRISEIPSGPHQCRSAGPEYESIDALGPNCFCSDTEAITHANARCNQLGLDTISVGGVIAFAMECHEHGLLDDPVVDLAWGNPAAIL
ncbi:aldehyde ferredoxin oxidoreductase, partial [Candidatus Bipolaricaulota bacterium]|nr:aldehyde ferredoxin oxidoreductase [Candidatus Bipolaricaulota bacterium]